MEIIYPAIYSVMSSSKLRLIWAKNVHAFGVGPDT
jgi:hypothetical protein